MSSDVIKIPSRRPAGPVCGGLLTMPSKRAPEDIARRLLRAKRQIVEIAVEPYYWGTPLDEARAREALAMMRDVAQAALRFMGAGAPPKGAA